MMSPAAKRNETTQYNLTITTAKPAPQVTVLTPPPGDKRSIDCSICGEQYSEYLISLGQGQAVNIILSSANKNTRFNLLPPKGEDTAAKRNSSAKYNLQISTGQ